MTAESPLDRLRALAEKGTGTDLTPTRLRMDPNADGWWCEYLAHLDDQWRQRLRTIIDALEAESETTVEWGVEYDDGKVTNCGEHDWLAETFLRTGQREGRWPQLVGESPPRKSVRIVTRAVTTHRTEWSAPDE